VDCPTAIIMKSRDITQSDRGGSMGVPYIDLSRQNDSLVEAFSERAQELIQKSDYILGPALEQFEQRCREYFKTQHALGVASGTDALLISLKACGVGQGDEVILP